MTRLPILMYHNISKENSVSKGLVISEEKLEKQFGYLAQKGFATFHFSELENRHSIPSKTVIITFDDVTENQLIVALPLLLKYNLKATFFIPFGYLGRTDFWNKNTSTFPQKIMSIEQLKSLGDNVELGLHSFSHHKYVNLSESEMNEDFKKCFELIDKNNLKVYNALAYPYGNYPKKEPEKSLFQSILKTNNIKIGLRIGNKLNRFPFKNPYEIMRIDVKGEDGMFKFRLKLRLGKLKLF